MCTIQLARCLFVVVYMCFSNIIPRKHFYFYESLMFICMIYAAIYRFKRALFLYTLVDIKYDSAFFCVCKRGCSIYYYVLLCVTAASSAVCNTPLKRNIAKLSTLWARLGRPSGRRSATATGTASLFQCVVLWDLCAWMCCMKPHPFHKAHMRPAIRSWRWWVEYFKCEIPTST